MYTHKIAKISKNCEQKCIRFYLHPSSILTYYLLTCEFSFCFLLNIIWNNKWLCVITLQYWQCRCTLHTFYCTTSEWSNISFIHRTGPSCVLSTTVFYDVMQQRVYQSWVHTKWSSACWIFSAEWAIALSIIQLTSGVDIFTHVCGQTAYTLTAVKLLNSIDSCQTWRFRFCGLWHVFKSLHL